MIVKEIKSLNEKFIIELALLCTDCEITVEKENFFVSGDSTEKAIAKDLEILKDNDKVITGMELNNIKQKQLEKK